MHRCPVAWIDGTVEQYAGGTNTLLLGIECRRLAPVLERDGRVVQQTPRHDDRPIGRSSWRGVCCTTRPSRSRTGASLRHSMPSNNVFVPPAYCSTVPSIHATGQRCI